MKQLLYLQMRATIPVQCLVFCLVSAIVFVYPQHVDGMKLFAIYTLIIFFLPQPFDYLLENNYYKQLLTTPLRTKSIYQASFIRSALIIFSLTLQLLIVNCMYIWSLDERFVFDQNSILYDAIIYCTFYFVLYLIVAGVMLLYSVWKGLHRNAADEFLLFFGLVLCLGYPILFTLFQTTTIVFIAPLLAISSCILYLVCYISSFKLVPHLMVKIDLQKDAN